MTLSAGQPVGSSTAPGWVAESTRTSQVPSSGSITTTETVIQSLTFTAVAAARYKIVAVQSFQSTVTGDVMRARIRYQSGSSLTTAGTELISVLPVAHTASKGIINTIVAPTLTGISGTYTVGVTLVRDSGTGNLVSYGDVKQTDLIMVERV